jgi:hypothetical protein
MRTKLLRHIRKNYDIYLNDSVFMVFESKRKLHFGSYFKLRPLLLDIVCADFGFFAWSQAYKKHQKRESVILMKKAGQRIFNTN